jgi:hypothetical protein
MKTQFAILGAAALLLTLAGCRQRSVLSDVELTDPSLLSPDVVLERTTGADGKAETTVHAYALDKNGDAVEIKNGGVTLNGEALAVDYKMVNNVPFYRPANPRKATLEPGTTYRFEFELSDGKRYACEIVSQRRALTRLEAPSPHPKDKPMTIRWRDDSDDDYLTLEIETTVKRDNVETIEHDEVPIPQDARGEYEIPAAYFDDANARSAELTLISLKPGEVADEFGGGDATARFKATATIVLE